MLFWRKLFARLMIRASLITTIVRNPDDIASVCECGWHGGSILWIGWASTAMIEGQRLGECHRGEAGLTTLTTHPGQAGQPGQAA